MDRFLNVSVNDVFSFGRNPVGIDIMTSVKGLNFEDVYKLSTIFDDDGLFIRLLHIDHLMEAKKASGRLKDLDDIQQIRKIKGK